MHSYIVIYKNLHESLIRFGQLEIPVKIAYFDNVKYPAMLQTESLYVHVRLNLMLELNYHR